MLHKRGIPAPCTKNIYDTMEKRVSAFSSVPLHEINAVYATVIVTLHDLKYLLLISTHIFVFHVNVVIS